MLWDLSRSPSSDTLGVNSASLPPSGPLRHHPAWGLTRTDSVYGAYNDDHIYFGNSNIAGTARTAKFPPGIRGYGEMPPACISTAYGLPDSSPGMFSSSVLMTSLARPASPPLAPAASITARRYNAPPLSPPSSWRQNSYHSGSARRYYGLLRFDDAGTLRSAGNLDGAGRLPGGAGLSISGNNSKSYERTVNSSDSAEITECVAIDNLLAKEDAEKMPVFFAAAGDSLVAGVVQTGYASGHDEVVGGSSTSSGRDSTGVDGEGRSQEVYPSGFVGPSGKTIPGGGGRRSTGSGGVVIRSAAVLPLRRLVLLGCSDGWVRLSI